MDRPRHRVVLGSLQNATRAAIAKGRERRVASERAVRPPGAAESDTFYGKEGRFSGQV